MQFLGVGEVFRRDSEAAGGDLLDAGAAGVAVGFGDVAGGVFAAFAGVGEAAEAVHGDGDAFVGFAGDGAVGHGSGDEAADDAVFAFDFVEGMACVSSKPKSPRRVQRVSSDSLTMEEKTLNWA